MNESMNKNGLEAGGIAEGKTLSVDAPEMAISLSKEGMEKLSGARIASFLSPPPSIEQRLMAALGDEYSYQVVYYSRCEGATSAIHRIVKANPSIIVAGVHGNIDKYRRAGIPYKDYRDLFNRLNTPFNLRNAEAIILDIVPESDLRKIRAAVLPFARKLIVLKPIQD
ncbi:hypothetical protein [Paenibacillus sp. FSL R5-808]|jgi:hypothetical protein|uniref:hypothetical protein n=1 Tax=unclassified Paenibacillus TaxID=185978 RepID=UPI0003E2AC01|nr:hypothetical protein [Paenibacillus sp. FSL R5-808]ETT32146.1 hypothetical protein C169_24090 [Paenibacillus sp. FSL R5-808]